MNPASPSDPTDHLSVTVAILTRNRLPVLQLSLASVLPQLLPGDEVLILDTGSSDGTRSWLDAHPAENLRWKPIDTPGLDFGAARNAAAQAGQADAVAFLDDDCIPAPDWLQRIRRALSRADAAGGLALFGEEYRFPWWWSPNLAWTVGMSGHGLIQSAPDSYPSTSNLAVRREELLVHPFAETPHGFDTSNIYLGGREDAEWWLAARLRGARLTIEPTSIVFHKIPPDRLCWSYIWNRARTDGRAAWARRRFPEIAVSALHEAADGALSALLAAVRGRFPDASSHLIWAARQHALAAAARLDPQAPSALTRQLGGSALGKAGVASARRHTGKAWFQAVRRLRTPFSVPPVPRRMLVAAPTFVGDTILLQPALRLLASAWPEADIHVWSTFPELLTSVPLPANLRVVTQEEVRRAAAVDPYQVTFAPYYHFGEAALWRDSLSRRGVTFPRDVGFSRERDYHLAAHTVEKDFHLHEILNLVRLLTLWPLPGAVEPPRVAASVPEVERLLVRCPALADGRPWIALQSRPEISWKDWPYERWGALAARVVRETGARVVVYAQEGQGGTEHEIIRLSGLGTDDAIPLTVDLPALTALLSLATLAVGICSGPKHLAMALGVPTFTLYGPTEPERWGALFDPSLHGMVRSPVGTLTPREHQGLPPNYSMLHLSLEAATAGLLAHYRSITEPGRTSADPSRTAHVPDHRGD